MRISDWSSDVCSSDLLARYSPVATVTFDHMTKRFTGDTVAVQDFNLEVNDGAFLVLVGPSGCGKTTALRCIAGLDTIRDGRLLIGRSEGRRLGHGWCSVVLGGRRIIKKQKKKN